MAGTTARNLRLVDPETGEITQCAGCHNWERTYHELEKKYRGALSQIGKLRADKEAEARQHELWPQAVELFDYWKFRTKHKKARWTGDRFWIVQPFLDREGFRDCRDALIGLLGSDFHMKRGEYAKRKGQVFDEFERPFSSQGDFERFREMAPQPHPDTVAFFEWYDEWKAGFEKAFKAWTDSIAKEKREATG